MKLEIGAGKNQTPGYIHNDINEFDGIDIVGNPWSIDLPNDSLEEVIALGVIEHFTYHQVELAFKNIHRMLKAGGKFYFDVPDVLVWAKYFIDFHEGKTVPFEIHHIRSTLYGWQRWPGDEHKSGWTNDHMVDILRMNNLKVIAHSAADFIANGLERRRMSRPEDAHLYYVTEKI
jgi:predicted SAM-dependent methyltransferase